MRRLLAVVVLATTLVGLSNLTPAAAAPRDEWLQAGHDAGHTYANLGETQLTVAALKAMPAYPGMSRSEVEIGLSNVSDPLVEGDSLFTTSTAWDGENGRLARFDITTGQKLWVHDLLCFGYPSISSDSIVITEDCSVSDPGPAHVLSVDDASVRYYAADQLGLVHRGVAYLTNYGDSAYQDPWRIDAQDVATGDVLWTKSTASFADRMVPELASGDTLYVDHNGAIEAWNAATGHLRWSRTRAANVTPFAATPDALYIRWQNGDRHGITRWGAADGRTDWRIQTPEVSTPFALTPDTIYESGPDFLAARSATDGSLLWKRSGLFWSGLGQIVYAAGVVWARQQYNGLEGYNAANGRELVSDGAPPGPVTVAEGRVFVGSPDGRVFIYQIPS
jgi:outer membrane protein assembly factor BamB